MELIDIISSILIYGSGLLLLVIGISFVLSRTKTGYKSNDIHQSSNSIFHERKPLPRMNIEQNKLRKDQTVAYPQIFRLDTLKPKEIKIIRKSSSNRRESQEKLRFDPKDLSKTDGNGVRYTIINDDLKKKSIKAANFYL